MRVVVLIALAACSPSPSMSIDAAPTGDAALCALGAMGAPPFDCVAGGLAIDLDGTWTLTGTTMSDPFYTNMWTSMAITKTVTMRREGSGRCVFGLSDSGEPMLDQRWYIDDTFAAFSQQPEGARVPDWKQFLCVRPSDQALYYQSSVVGFQMQHQYASRTEGVLTR